MTIIHSMDDYLVAAAPIPRARIIIDQMLDEEFTRQQLERYCGTETETELA